MTSRGDRISIAAHGKMQTRQAEDFSWAGTRLFLYEDYKKSGMACHHRQKQQAHLSPSLKKRLHINRSVSDVINRIQEATQAGSHGGWVGDLPAPAGNFHQRQLKAQWTAFFNAACLALLFVALTLLSPILFTPEVRIELGERILIYPPPLEYRPQISPNAPAL